MWSAAAVVCYEIRDVHRDDIDDVVRIHNQVVGIADREYTIFSSPRVATYLRALVAWPMFPAQHRLVGVWDRHNLVAYAHCFTAKRPGCQWRRNDLADRCAIGDQSIDRQRSIP